MHCLWSRWECGNTIFLLSLYQSKLLACSSVENKRPRNQSFQTARNVTTQKKASHAIKYIAVLFKSTKFPKVNSPSANMRWTTSLTCSALLYFYCKKVWAHPVRANNTRWCLFVNIDCFVFSLCCQLSILQCHPLGNTWRLKAQPHARDIQATDTPWRCRVATWSNHMNATLQKRVAVDLHCCANRCYRARIKKSHTYQEVNVLSRSSFNMLSSPVEIHPMSSIWWEKLKTLSRLLVASRSSLWHLMPNILKTNNQSQ